MLITDVSSLQECVPEFLDIKQSVHTKLDVIVNDDVILSRSASSLVPSPISENLRHRNRFIYWSNVLTERFSIPYKNQTKEDTSF